MSPKSSAGLQRERDGEGPGGRSDHREPMDYSPGREELEQVVDVAAALGLSPETVRGAFYREDGGVPTDVGLREAVHRVEVRMAREGRDGRR